MERRNFLKRAAGASTFAVVGAVATQFREQPSLPSVEEMTSDLDPDRLTLALEGDGWRAVCHPDLGSTEYAAPFAFRTAGSPPSDEDVGEAFAEDFDGKVHKIWKMLDASDDPMKELMDLEPDDLMELD